MILLNLIINILNIKIMNLEDLNLVELEINEANEIEGGCEVCFCLVIGSHAKDFFRGLLNL